MDEVISIFESNNISEFKTILESHIFIIDELNVFINECFHYTKDSILKLLILYGADINTIDNDNNNVLDNTIMVFMNDIIKNNKDEIDNSLDFIIFLLKEKAKPNLQTIYDNLIDNEYNADEYILIGYIIELYVIYRADKININNDNEIFNLLFESQDMKSKEIIKSESKYMKLLC